MIDTDQEVFELDIAEYVDVSMLEERYLSQQFKDDYEYLLRSFVLQPLNGVFAIFSLPKFKLKKKIPFQNYFCGNSEFIFPKIFQWDESNVQEFSFRLKILDEKYKVYSTQFMSCKIPLANIERFLLQK